MTVFAPHPDDEVFGCGGLLALLVEQGRKVRVVVVSDGGFGDHGRDTLARKRESHAAANLLGYSLIEFWDLPDQGLNGEPSLEERIRQYLDDFPASLVLAPSLWEVHPDHIAVCRAAIEAVRRHPGTQVLWFYEVGVPMPRPFIVDISSVAERKWVAMNCFNSQLAVQDYAKQIAGLNTYRGYTLPVFGACGEAYFAPDPAWLHDGYPALLIDLLTGKLTGHSTLPLETILSDLQSSLAEMKDENTHLRNENAALLASTSWRITAPLRKIVETGRHLLSY